MENNIVFIFRAYYSTDHFNKQEFFSQEVFSDFDVMMKYSTEHYEAFKGIHPGYGSMYWKIELPV